MSNSLHKSVINFVNIKESQNLCNKVSKLINMSQLFSKKNVTKNLYT